jgi:hypothetical protein
MKLQRYNQTGGGGDGLNPTPPLHLSLNQLRTPNLHRALRFPNNPKENDQDED